MSSMSLDVWVRLRDRFSGGLKRIRSSIDKFGRVARRLGAVGGIIAGISFMGPVQQAAAFDQTLRDTAVTAGIVRSEVEGYIEANTRMFEELALATGQASADISAASGLLVAAGFKGDLDKVIPAIARTATAANAEIDDISKVVFALSDNLDIAEDQIENALGKLIQGGKEGRFELKEMAQYFATLTSQMLKLGIVGDEAVTTLAAGLQIAMKGASDPATAANNFKNFLSKMASPETVKSFKKAGVDILAVMQNAVTEGINPVEAVVQKITKLTGISGEAIDHMMQHARDNGLEGEEALAAVREQLEAIGGAGKLGELFRDQQVLDFLIPMIANLEEYKRIRDAVAAADSSVIEADFQIQQAGPTRQLGTFREFRTQAIREIGDAFAAWLPAINRQLLGLKGRLNGLDETFPGLKDKVLTFGSGAVLAAVALGVLGVAIPFITAGLGLLGAALALVFSPAGLLLGAIAGGAYWIYRNWGAIGPWFADLWDGVAARARRAWARVRSAWSDARAWFADLWPAIRAGADDAWAGLDARARQAWTGVRAAWGDARAWFSGLWPSIREGANSLWADLETFGSAAAADLKTAWAGVEDLFAGFREGLDLDLSAMTLPAIDVSPLEMLEGALTRLKSAWDGMADFRAGAAPYLQGIGKDAGETFGSIGKIATSLGRLGSALASLVGFDTSGLGNVRQWLGDLAGGSYGAAARLISTLAKALAELVSGLADLAEWAAGGQKPDWVNLFSPGDAAAIKAVGDAVKWVAEGVGNLWNLLNEPVEIPVLNWESLSSGFEAVKNAIVAGINLLIAEINGLLSLFSGFKIPSIGGGAATGPAPANDNVKDRARSNNQGAKFPTIPSSSAKPVAVVPKQAVDVGGTINVQVDGPAKVTGVSSSNKNVAVTANRGRAVGRV